MGSRGALVVIGIGPGIGRAVTTKFASEGFNRIFVLSRNAQRLEDEKAAVIEGTSNKSVNITAITADISKPASLDAALKEIDKSEELIETVFFNAARVAPSTLLEFPVEEIELDFKTTNTALYQVAQWLIPHLSANVKTLKRPSLIVTNSHLWKAPEPMVFSLSLTKAAQRVLVQTLNMTYAQQGIHVGLISVSGQVSPDNKILNPVNIADETWKFFETAENDKLEVELCES